VPDHAGLPATRTPMLLLKQHLQMEHRHVTELQKPTSARTFTTLCVPPGKKSGQTYGTMRCDVASVKRTVQTCHSFFWPIKEEGNFYETSRHWSHSSDARISVTE
jgi:hypothetical protein